MVAMGATVLAFAVVMSFAVAVVWALVWFVERVSAALVPVVAGIFLAMLFRPYYAWLLARVHHRVPALALLLASVFAPLGALVWFGGALVVMQVTHLVAAAPTVVARFSGWVNQSFPNLQTLLASMGLPPEQQLFFSDPAQFVHNLIAQLSTAYGEQAVMAGVGALKYFAWVGTGLLALLFFVYFLTRPPMRGQDCVAQMPFLKDGTRAFVAGQIDGFFDIVTSFFQRQVIICLIEGFLYGLGFTLTGLPYGFVLGFVLGALNLVPFLGSVVVLPLALPIAYFGDDGSLWRLVGTLAVWLAGQLLDGYLITPKIQGDKTGLGYAGVIFSFVFWGLLFNSLLGLLLAIPLSAFCVVFWRALKTQYIKGVI